MAYPVYAANPSSSPVPDHPVFQGPFAPVTTTFTGDRFAHASFNSLGPLEPILYDLYGRTYVAEVPGWGGRVLVGGLTADDTWSPQPEAANFKANLIAFAASPPDPVLSVVGSCGGPATIDITYLTPNGPFAVVRGSGLGTTAIPAGGCSGTDLGMTGVSILKRLQANGDGEVHASPNLSPSLCGSYLQVLDLTGCRTSDVVGPL